MGDQAGNYNLTLLAFIWQIGTIVYFDSEENSKT